MLREPVATFTYEHEFAAAFRLITERLRDFGLEVEKSVPDTGEIVARCLSLSLNLGLWRCWSDNLLLQLRARGPATTVQVYTLPNLRRWKVGRHERVTQLHELLSALQTASN